MTAGADGAQWFWQRPMSSDARTVSTPIYSRTIPGALRLLGDTISGPHAGRGQSVRTIEEQLDHLHEVQQTAAAHAVHRQAIAAAAAASNEWDRSVTPSVGRP